MHRASRFVVAFSAKKSEAEAAPEVVRQTRERTRGRRGIVWISDGHRVYARAIRRTYRFPQRTGRPGRPRYAMTPGVGLTQVVKTREGHRIVKVEIRHCFGPQPSSPHTVLVERHNGVLRDRLGCLTRKTHAFARRVGTWNALVGLSLFEHNWLRPAVALRQRDDALPNGQVYRKRSPAMAIGLADHVWRWTDFLTRKPRKC